MDDKIFFQQAEDERGFDPMGIRHNRCPKPDKELEERVRNWIDEGIQIYGMEKEREVDNG